MNGAPAAAPLPKSELVGYLSPCIGEEKADQSVTEAAGALGLGGGPYELEAAMRILVRLAATPGIVGTSARFAKTRLHLKTASAMAGKMQY